MGFVVVQPADRLAIGRLQNPELFRGTLAKSRAPQLGQIVRQHLRTEGLQAICAPQDREAREHAAVPPLRVRNLRGVTFASYSASRQCHPSYPRCSTIFMVQRIGEREMQKPD